MSITSAMRIVENWLDAGMSYGVSDAQPSAFVPITACCCRNGGEPWQDESGAWYTSRDAGCKVHNPAVSRFVSVNATQPALSAGGRKYKKRLTEDMSSACRHGRCTNCSSNNCKHSCHGRQLP